LSIFRSKRVGVPLTHLDPLKKNSLDMSLTGRLGRIHGTEDDRVNCPFYLKIGACRHGDFCERNHLKPTFSETILLKHLWMNAFWRPEGQPDEATVQKEFDDFYCEVFEEVNKVGAIQNMFVCENTSDHLTGHVFISFADEEIASDVMDKVQGRFFCGREIKAEYSPVRDFGAARCKRFDDSECERAGACNFMHMMQPSPALFSYLEEKYEYRGGKASALNRRAYGGGDRDRRGGYDRGDRGGGYDRRRRDRSSSYDRGGGSGDRRRDRGDSRDRGDYRRRDYDRGDRDRGGGDRYHRRDREGSPSRSRSRDREPGEA
jgi:splicing factor U2AF 35 kDa subunit